MAHVYVYGWDNEDYSTIGECGALDATSCTFEEVGNGMSEISLMHPVDSLGKHAFLCPGAVLKANVPVRTMPEIENGAFVTQVESWTIKQTATKQQRYVYSKKEGGRKTKTLKLGAELIVTSKPADSERWKIKSGKVSGWILSSGLERSVDIIVPDTAEGIETAAPAWESREQLFRIYKVEKADDGISCSARHIQYDLLQNMTTFDTNGSTTLQESGNAILENCIDPHDFRFYTDITGTQTGAHYVDTDPISAFLNPESGLAAAWNAQQVRDNFDIFMLAEAGMDRGMRIEYARNMLGVQMDEDIESTATAIRPIGQKKDGKPLYLDGDGLVISPNADKYPFKRIYKLECTDCTVGTNGVTEAIAKARMLEQAEALLADGVDMPQISVRVTFASLGHTERYAQYRNLENVFLYDTVAIINPRLQINVKTQAVRIMWDCLREKMLSVELGSLQALSPSVAGWQISGGISGGKLVQGSVGAAQLGSEAITTRHIQADSINAEALQAESVTAEKIAAGSVTAEKLQADIIDAVSIEAVIAHIEEIVAGQITTDRLYAALAKFDVLNAGSAYFDKATIKHLVSSALNLEYGVGEEVFIENLKVAYAQMVAATIGNLCIKASDGNYYNIDVNADGTVTASKVQVNDGEIAAGQTDAGRVILGTDIVAENLSTGDLLATYALVNKIDAARIDVDQLWAREAFIDLLRTSQIVGGKSITIIAEDAAAAMNAAKNAAKTFRQEVAPGVEDGVKTGDLWIQPSTGAIRQADAIGFVIDENGIMYLDHVSGDGYEARISANDPYSMEVNFPFTIQADGTVVGLPVTWSIVQDESILEMIDNISGTLDGELDELQEAIFNANGAAQDAGEIANAAVKSIGDIPNYIEITAEGLAIKDIEGASVLRANSGSVSIGTLAGASQGFSQLAGNYVQFGNYQMRRATDGGLVFKMA